MSMFQIHKDSEKENKNLVSAKDRTLLTAPLVSKILNVNSSSNDLQQATQIRSHFSELTNGKCLQENNNNQPFVKKEISAFKVYEDEVQEPRKVETSVRENIDAIKSEEQKFPNDEILLSPTPMSVSDLASPMSIDPSLTTLKKLNDNEIFLELGNGTQKSQNLEYAYPKHDKDRFFEVVQYQMDILEYFRESEVKNRAKPNYMRRQNDINQSMRTILVDWLVEVSEEYKLDTETLYLSVLFIDRFLSHMSVMRNKLQLVGTTAMYIASKYEEIYPPEISDFVFITDDTFNKSQILRMEQIMLKILSFDLCSPSAYAFINMYAVITDQIPMKIKMMALYISELSLLEADPYLRFLPSVISAAAIALARITCSLAIWTEDLVRVTSYSIEDLKEALICLSKSHNAAKDYKLQAIQDKYKSDKYARVALIPPLEQIDSVKFDELAKIYYNWTATSKEQENTH